MQVNGFCNITFEKELNRSNRPWPHGGLTLLLFSSFVAITTEILPVGLLIKISARHEVSEGAAGLLVTFYAVAVAALALPITRFTAHLPRKQVLISTVLSYGVSNLAVGLAPDFVWVCIGRGLGGVAHALFFSTVAAYAAGLVKAGMEGRAISVAYAGSSLGFVAGVPLGTAVAQIARWETAFLGLACFSVLLSVVMIFRLPALPSRGRIPARIEVSRWWRSGLITITLLCVLVYLGHFVIYTFAAVLITRATTMPGSVGLGFLVFGLAGVLGLLVAGVFVDRDPRITLIAVLACMSVALGFLPAVMESWGWLLALGAIWNLAFGAIPTLLTTAAIRTRGSAPELAAALANAGPNLGIAAGAMIGGLIYESSGLTAVAATATVFTALALAVALRSRRAFVPRAQT